MIDSLDETLMLSIKHYNTLIPIEGSYKIWYWSDQNDYILQKWYVKYGDDNESELSYWRLGEKLFWSLKWINLY